MESEPNKETIQNLDYLYLVKCEYSRGQCNLMSFDTQSVNFYFEYFKRFKNVLPPGPTVYG